MAVMGLAGVAGTTGLHPDRAESSCTATGGNAFNPALSSEQICAQFVGALGNHAGNIRIALRFSARGSASAAASHLRDGVWHQLPLLELSVMDRRFNRTDIDRLAQDVLGGLTAAAAPEGN